MGLRADLDSVKVRYIYFIMIDDIVRYVGTAVKPKQRFKTHLKRSQTGTSPIYRFIRKCNSTPKLRIVKKITGTYEYAESEEIEKIIGHQDTVLNFYNNPNKENIELILNAKN